MLSWGEGKVLGNTETLKYSGEGVTLEHCLYETLLLTVLKIHGPER